jgi:hypothetical protein
MSLSRRLVVLFALLCLLGAQQAAFAHWAAHLGAPVETGLEPSDGEHAAAAVLGQTCTNCAAFAGLEAALPRDMAPAATALPLFEPLLPAPPQKSVAAARRYDSRAPPVLP